MNIDTEKMRVAVLAECERVCPDTRYKSLNPLGIVRISDEKMHGYNLDGVDVAWAIMYRGDVVCFLYDGTSSDLIDFAYRLLGLETRDTIAKEREISDEYLDRLKAERAKSAKLVEALEECLKTDYCDFHEAPSLIEEAKDILAANEKGGKNA